MRFSTPLPCCIERLPEECSGALALPSLIRTDPMGLTCETMENGLVRFSHGSNALDVPDIGRWPLVRFHPLAIADTIDEILADAKSDSTHEDSVRTYALEAISLAIACDTMPEHALRDEQGGYQVEMCLEDDLATPFAWVLIQSPQAATPSWERLPVDEDLIETPFTVPCGILNDASDRQLDLNVVGIACNSSDGIGFASLRLDADMLIAIHERMGIRSDPMRMLRLLESRIAPETNGWTT